MSITYGDAKIKIGHYLRDTNWADNHTNEILQAFNDALKAVNSVRVGDRNQLQVGFDFQREIQDIPFDQEKTGDITTAGTTTLIDSSATFESDGVAPGDEVENTTDASFSRVISVDSETQLTVSTPQNGTDNDFDVDDSYKIPGKGYTIASSWNFKFPYYLTPLEDRDIEFIYQQPNYFERKKGVSRSGEYMFTIRDLPHGGAVKVIQINYVTTEALYFEFFSNNIVRTSTGVRGTTVSSDSDILLIPDSYYEVPVKLAVADLKGQMKGYIDPERAVFLNEGRTELMQMANSIGIKQKLPEMRMRTRSEWASPLSRVKDTD